MEEKPCAALIQDPVEQEKPKLTLFEAIELQDEARKQEILREIIRLANEAGLDAELVSEIFASKEILLGKTSKAWIEEELQKSRSTVTPTVIDSDCSKARLDSPD